MNSVIQYLFKLTSFMKTATQEMSTQNFKGVSMDKIYRNFDPWDLDHLPPVENTRNHTVLFQLPISKVQPLEPPTPHIGKGKWDSNHVRLPCASQNEYKTESSVCSIFPAGLMSFHNIMSFYHKSSYSCCKIHL